MACARASDAGAAICRTLQMEASYSIEERQKIKKMFVEPAWAVPVDDSVPNTWGCKGRRR
jgi:hypothetical protein